MSIFIVVRDGDNESAFSENEKPMVFQTFDEALSEIIIYCNDSREAVEMGYMQDADDWSDFEILELESLDINTLIERHSNWNLKQ